MSAAQNGGWVSRRPARWGRPGGEAAAPDRAV